MKVCTASQMRNIDRMTISTGGIPGIVLMENAAMACVDAINKKFSVLKNKRIAIFCGKGNNGGDGFAVARLLFNKGADVSVYLVCGDEFNGDALINFDIIDRMGIHIEQVYDTGTLDLIIPSYDIVVDAIYGTGIHGEVQGISREVIQKINGFSKYLISIDVPSGMNSDTGEICGVCVNADMTVTFAAYKLGMFLYPAADCTGEILLYDISIPEYILQCSETSAEVLSAEDFAELFPKRKNNSHKGDYGKLLIVGGSKGMSGSVYMASEAALNSGAGLITIAAPECINDILESKTTEVMTAPMRDTNGHFSAISAMDIIERAEKVDAVLIGPGMGTSNDCKIILEELLKNAKTPVIVDADALNILAKNMDILEKCSCPLIFTPHEMEISRLTGLDIEYIKNNRLSVSKEFCEKYGVTLILKGHHTIVTAPDGLQYINNTGNSGLAKGGSGDVLAGITAAMSARGISEPQAAALAVYLHGAAADMVMENRGIEGVTPMLTVNEIGPAIKKLAP